MGRWEMVRLGDVCALKSGNSLPDGFVEENGNIPYVKVSDLNLKRNTPYITTSTYFTDRDGVVRQVFPVGTVVFPKRGGAIGTNKKRLTSCEICADLNIMGVIPSEDILPHYLFSFFQTIDLGSLQNGSSIPQINNGDIAPLQIPLPPLPIQRKIADVIDRASALIEKRKAQIEKLDLLVKSRFIEMFGDPVTNPMGWEVRTVDSILVSVRYGTSTPPVFSETGFMFIRATNIKNGTIIRSDMKFINDDEAKRIMKCKIATDEMIIVRSGVNTGDTCVITEQYSGHFAGYDIILSLDNSRISALFLNQLINTKYMDVVIKPLTRRAAQPHLNAEQIKSLNIPLPPLPLQTQFATFVTRVESQKTLLQQSLAKLELNYKSLMQKCFSGEMF